jgi:ribonuclease-3
MAAQDFHELLTSLNIAYKDDSLYEAAFTHASYRNENIKTCKADYDRLEFIGDGVLDLIIADFLYHRFPKMDSGELSKTRALLVRGATETSFARKMHFENYIRVSKGEEKSGNISDKILEDVFESFIGAYYLDNSEDFQKTKKLVRSFFAELIENYQSMEEFDYKSHLQEIVQGDVKMGVDYKVIKETGEGLDKRFLVEASCNGIVLGSGEGTSKKKAEQAAAKDAIDRRVQ